MRLTLQSLLTAFVFAYPVAFILLPDPTGMLPMLVGLVSTIVLTPVIYLWYRRASS
ncbi:hypothetical protein [Haloferax mucosum]|uniref:hypothetical protein n=1 Tax=Haloferax mucosum TaxID=403181 RepID=UPI000325AF94|nr:hypothetical protein [Haloferax mucosum]